MLFCFLFAFDGQHFSIFGRLVGPFGLMWKFLGRRPKPALLFFIAKKVSKKASPPSRRPQDKPILSRAFYNSLRSDK